MSAYEHILYEKRGHVAYVTLNRPQVMNALHPPAHRELADAWADYMADDNLWVAILTGAGERAFSAGSDLKYRVTEADERELRDPSRQRGHILDRCWKPIIAAVNGYAVGGGLELAMRCDIIVAAEHARFGLPEARRGLLADAGGVIKLPRRIPYHLAMSLILTGQVYRRPGSPPLWAGQRGRADGGADGRRRALGARGPGMRAPLDPGRQAGRS